MEQPIKKYEIEYSKNAERNFAKLPPKIIQRIAVKIEELKIEPRPHGCKKLKAYYKTYRISIGDYRVIYEINDNKLIILILDTPIRNENTYH